MNQEKNEYKDGYFVLFLELRGKKCKLLSGSPLITKLVFKSFIAYFYAIMLVQLFHVRESFLDNISTNALLQ